MNIYVGNLPYSVSEDDLKRLFEEFGSVKGTKVITDRASGRSKGFGFVEMGSHDEGERAISALNGKEFQGRTVVVSEARPKPEGGASAFGDRRR